MSDLINRQDAINALTESNLKRHMDSVEGGQENRSAIRIIMGLPSADRKRGEWALNDDQVYECKDCRYVPSFDGYTYFNYCPNCGADMRGGKDEQSKV